ncbi:hypothetical protein R3P38DRAFT_1332 [Favolaschia claudopus]|uniref:Uncharacterized protein n=1 Tax=Favolaschia claudopus TaxID=2862362 RepID=A0AAW0EGX8_9AGAR
MFAFKIAVSLAALFVTVHARPAGVAASQQGFPCNSDGTAPPTIIHATLTRLRPAAFASSTEILAVRFALLKPGEGLQRRSRA